MMTDTIEHHRRECQMPKNETATALGGKWTRSIYIYILNKLISYASQRRHNTLQNLLFELVCACVCMSQAECTGDSVRVIA